MENELRKKKTAAPDTSVGADDGQPLHNSTVNSISAFDEEINGDFQNSVCLHDFLHRIKSRDTRLMAYDLMAGDTIDEIRTYRRWSRDHTYRTYNRLRLRMEEYLSI